MIDASKAAKPAIKKVRLNKTDQRIATLKTWFKDDAEKLVKTLPKTGVNSPDNVIVRASAAIRSRGNDNDYLQHLAASIRANHPLSQLDVITIVADVRNRCGLPPITGKTYFQCLLELQKVAVLRPKVMLENGVKRKMLVPSFKLLK